MAAFTAGFLLAISLVASYGGNQAELLPFTAGFGAAGVVWAVVLSHLAAVLFLYFAISIFVRGLRELIGGPGPGA